MCLNICGRLSIRKYTAYFWSGTQGKNDTSLYIQYQYKCKHNTDICKADAHMSGVRMTHRSWFLPNACFKSDSINCQLAVSWKRPVNGNSKNRFISWFNKDGSVHIVCTMHLFMHFSNWSVEIVEDYIILVKSYGKGERPNKRERR